MPTANETPIDSNLALVTPLVGDLTGLRILVVDDDMLVARLIARILERAGAIVSMTCSAAAAFEALLAFEPDVLVSDIEMPDEDGYSLVRRVRAHDATAGRTTRALALSGATSLDAVDSAAKAGFSRYMSKPFRAAELVHTLAAMAMPSVLASGK
jgi:CheY-like chemotaxis protein